jgi:uncharacterized protein YndB with AHSA1/START domain
MSRNAPPGDQVTVSVSVAVDQTAAFEIFTREIDLWWRRSPRFRFGRQPGCLSFELEAGGRLFESFPSESGTYVREVGRVTVWEPPSRLVFNWRNVNFADDESTEVEVLFQPTQTGTTVTVRHRGWATLRPDHPARHGLQGADFIRKMGMWWGELLTGFSEFAEQPQEPV